MNPKKITVALAGNPNSGKTTIFNALTGARQHVGNYPGVTVEQKEGFRTVKGYEIRFVDLPGTYSLTAHSIEEVVARDFIFREQPDLVVDVIDASNFERNLYLTTQLLELNVPMLLALNMSDVAEKQGFAFDDRKLSAFFASPVVHTVGSKGRGIERLLAGIIKELDHPSEEPKPHISYGKDIKRELDKIEAVVDQEHQLVSKYGKTWLALKLLEQDEDILTKGHTEETLAVARQSAEALEQLYGDRADILVAEKRYGYVSGVYEQTVKRTIERRHDISDCIDKVLLNRVLGLPLFLGLMYLVFMLTFSLGEYPMGWIESGFGWLGGVVSGWWPEGSESPLKSLLVDGIIDGVGGVIIFLPNIIFLFLAIALLEDSGYMARAAFLMDRVMKKMGLHGKSFIPMLIGFGCSVPAIMGTRILEDRKARLATIMTIPLMSCGARFPIYALIIPCFFATEWRASMMLLIYLIGVLLAILCTIILRKTFLKGDSGLFLLELPPYRMPTLRGLAIHMWERSWLYLKKAGTVILMISIILWALTSYPKPAADRLENLSPEAAQQAELQHSVAGRLGKIMEPVIRPLGFDYRIGTALIGALAAKEVFVSQMAIVFSVGEEQEESQTLREKLKANYTPLQGFCVMLFCLISAPCVATLAITRRETGSWGWALLQFGGLTVLAYALTLAVYQIGLIIQ